MAKAEMSIVWLLIWLHFQDIRQPDKLYAAGKA